MVSKELENFRKKLDKIDNRILSLLKERKNVSLSIGRFKKQNNLPIKNLKRETEILKKLGQKAEKFNLGKSYINKLFQIIMENSRKIQRELNK